MKIYATVKQNKSGEGTHAELRVNLEYTDRLITYDKGLIAEILGVTIKELSTAPIGKVYEIK